MIHDQSMYVFQKLYKTFPFQIIPPRNDNVYVI